MRVGYGREDINHARGIHRWHPTVFSQKRRQGHRSIFSINQTEGRVREKALLSLPPSLCPLAFFLLSTFRFHFELWGNSLKE